MPVSEFGKYEGYSDPIYDEWVRRSQYVAMRDGVKLAVDIVRPVWDGNVVEEPLPAVWTHHRYHRATWHEGRVLSIVDLRSPLQTLIKHGYAVVAVDSRGSGASYGQDVGTYNAEQTKDAYEITEWLAGQTWCDGNVGMFGASFSGITQLMAASLAPPHLKAIFPSLVGFDLYDLLHPGGAYRRNFLEGLFVSLRQLDLELSPPRVDEDRAGAMLAEAISEHRGNFYEKVRVSEAASMFRNSRLREYGGGNPVDHLQAIKKAGVPAYLWAGWLDIYARDVFQWFVNLEGRVRLTVGPWCHSMLDPEKLADMDALLGIEQLRWFDYWLKDIDNGIVDEPALNFAIVHEQRDWRWSSAATWPLPECEHMRWFFAAGPSGSVPSANDGVLSAESPSRDTGRDDYKVDYSTTSGHNTRWTLPRPGPLSYPDMTPNDAKGITYTSAPFAKDTTVVGHPVVSLYLASTAADGDFFAYLEDVDEDNVSHYVSEGVLRASHRAVAEPPFNNLGLPYHRSFEEDVLPLPKGEPVELKFDLLPTAYVFRAGHRIRVAITCADVGNADVYAVTPPPTVTVYRNSRWASSITLPIAPTTESPGAGTESPGAGTE